MSFACCRPPKLSKFLPAVFFLFLISFIAIFPIRTYSHHPQGQIYSYRLENGLTLLVRENHKTPIVTVYCLVKTGSAAEAPPYGRGLSHFVEHMLYKGTKEYKAGQIHEKVRSLGGTTNALTSFDYTAYQITIPKESFKQALEILRQMLKEASFEQSEIDREREVILKEIEMSEDNPERAVFKNLLEEAFAIHPYRFPILGYEDLLSRVTRKELLDFYRTHYLADKMIISIAGDIGHQEAYLACRKLFSNFKKDALPEKESFVEPPQTSKRIQIEQDDLQIGYLALGFKGLSITDDDLCALDILANILGQGRSSRLSVKLKDQLKLVFSISSYNFSPKNEGLFIISATLEKDNLDKAIGAILDEIDKIKQFGVTETELRKAKNSISLSHLNHLQTTMSQARDSATSFYLTGDPEFSFKYVERINQQTKDDLKKAANKYLLSDKLTVSGLLPRETSSRDEPGSRKDDPNDPGKNPHPIQKVVLPDGITLLLREDRTLPIVDIQVLFKGGLRYEDEDQNGICNLMTQMLLEGTKTQTKEELNQLLEERGITIDLSSHNNSFGLSANLLSGDLDFMLSVLSDLILNPAFKESQLADKKELIKAGLRRQKDDAFDQAFLTLRRNFFENHPYSLDPLGSEDSISEIKREDLLKFYRQMVRPENLTLAIFGDIDPGQTRKLVGRYFADFKSEDKAFERVDLPHDNFKKGRNLIIEETDKRQAIIMAGFSAPPNTAGERYAFSVLNSFTSGGASKLFYSLRDEKALAYQVGTFSLLGFEPGCWVFYIATSEDLIEEAKGGLLNEIEKLKNYQFSKKELEATKKSLIGSHYINLQTNRDLSFRSALDQMYGLGYDSYKTYEENINRVTADDLKRVIDQYLDLNNSTMLILKPQEK
jgi:zinc protease